MLRGRCTDQAAMSAMGPGVIHLPHHHHHHHHHQVHQAPGDSCVGMDEPIEGTPDVAVVGSVFQGAHNVHTHGGSWAAAGRDIVYNTVYNVADSLPQSHRRDSLRHLPGSNYAAMQQDIYNRRTPDTGLAFLQRREVLDWGNSEDSAVICATGIPGAGKTYQTSCLIHQFQERAREYSGVLVAFVFIRYSDMITEVEVLAACTKQIAMQSSTAFDLAVKLLRRHQDTDTQPLSGEYLNLLQTVAEQGARIFYFLDALDEAKPDVRYGIVKAFMSLKGNKFFTSRPSSPLQSQLLKSSSTTSTFLDIVPEEADLRLLIFQRIDQSPEFCHLLDAHNVKDKIVDEIASKSGGMFLHASLQIEAVRHCVDLDSMRKTLMQCPSALEDLYLKTWERIDHQPKAQADLAKRICLWLIHAARSLSIGELQYALAVSTDSSTHIKDRLVLETTLSSVCCGLVTVDIHSEVVRLVHYTAKQALQPHVLGYDPKPQLSLAQGCMVHLINHKLPILQNSKSSRALAIALGGDPFVKYAYQCLGFHVLECEKSHPESLDHIVSFLRQCQSYPYRIKGSLSRGPLGDVYGLTPLHVGVLLGTRPLLQKLVEEDQMNPNIPAIGKNGVGLTPLMVAAREGREQATEFLLSHPEIDVDASNYDGSNALIMASVEGKEHIVDQILCYSQSQETRPIATAFDKIRFQGLSAFLRGQSQSSKTRVNATDNLGWTPLMQASRNGHKIVVARLLQVAGIQVNDRHHWGWTALHLAAFYGREDIVELLLNHPDIQINGMNDDGSTALMLAAGEGHEGIVRRLLACTDIEVNEANNKGVSALNAAANRGHTTVVRHLLEFNGIKINSADSKGWTPLTSAAYNGHVDIVRQLLHSPQIQVNYSSSEHNGDTALIVSSARGHVAITKRLLEFNEIDVNKVNNRGWTPLTFAASSGWKDIVRLLLDHPNIQPNLATTSGLTAVMGATKHGHEEVAQLLTAWTPRTLQAAPQPS